MDAELTMQSPGSVLGNRNPRVSGEEIQRSQGADGSFPSGTFTAKTVVESRDGARKKRTLG